MSVSRTIYPTGIVPQDMHNPHTHMWPGKSREEDRTQYLRKQTQVLCHWPNTLVGDFRTSYSSNMLISIQCYHLNCTPKLNQENDPSTNWWTSGQSLKRLPNNNSCTLDEVHNRWKRSFSLCNFEMVSIHSNVEQTNCPNLIHLCHTWR